MGGGGAVITSGSPPTGLSANLAIYLPLQTDLLDDANNNDGTFSGGSPSFVAAFGGQQALDCDGADDLVTIAADVSFQDLQAYTFSACINIDSYGEVGSGRIVQWDDSGGGSAVGWRLGSSITSMRFEEERYATTNGLWRAPNGTIQLTTDYHIAVTYNHSTLTAQLYVDGAAVSTIQDTAPVGTFDPDAAALNICNNAAQTRANEGRIAHLRLYTDVKPASFISQVAAADCP